MKRIISFFLALLIIASTTEIHQLAKVPLLISHYQNHRQTDPSLSFFGFLKIHYGDKHPEDNDDQEDNELPFKSSISIFHIDTPTVTKKIAVGFYTANKKETSCPLADGILCHRSFSIFHPPREA
jgi:hypothetical protein